MASNQAARGKARAEAETIRLMLAGDLFGRLRDDAELAGLVRDAAARSTQPYAWLMQRLVGAEAGLDEAVAQRLWLEAVEHRRWLQRAVGRPVTLRVAMLDLCSVRRDLAPRRPLLVTASVLSEVMASLTTDPLTGLVNRERFGAIVEHELRQRFRMPPVVAYMDLDGFKQVNDRHGHAEGDRVLAVFGEVARRVARRADVFARLGGDEFGALFVDCGIAKAREVVRRLRAAFLAQTKGLAVDLSTGVVSARSGEPLAALIERADRAMYALKRAKRRPPRRPRRAGAAVAVFVGADPDAFFELSVDLADWGHALLPAARLEVAGPLIALVRPRVVVVDEGLGAADVERLPARSAEATWLRLLSEGRPVTATSDPKCIRRPVDRRRPAVAARRALGPQAAPLRHLAGPAEAAAVMAHIDRLVTGVAEPRRGIREARDRHEVDLVVRHLGA